MLGGFWRVVQHFQAAREIFHHAQVLSNLAALFCAVNQLGQSDGRNRHIARMAVEYLKHFQRFAFDHIEHDIRVEQVTQHRLKALALILQLAGALA